MQNYYTPKSKHLTLTERRMIESWLQEGLSNREIARRLEILSRDDGKVKRDTCSHLYHLLLDSSWTLRIDQG